MPQDEHAHLVVSAWLTALVARVVERMTADEIPDALSQPVTLAAFIADLFDVAGAPVPSPIADLVGTRTVRA